MNKALQPRLLLVATALLFSTGGAAIKWTSLTGWQVSTGRTAVAALFLLLVLPEARRHWTPRIIFPALAYAATSIAFVLANKLTTSANTIFLQSTAPVYVVLLSPWLLREHIQRRDVLHIAALLAGLSLFFIGAEPASRSAPDPFHGNLLAVAAGFFWALTVLSFRWLEKHGETAGAAFAAVVLGNCFACLATLGPALPFPAISPVNVAAITFLGVFNIGLAYICLAHGIRAVPAIEASAILLIEPALNPVWAWMAQGERPGKLALAGGAIILGSTLARLWAGLTHGATAA